MKIAEVSEGYGLPSDTLRYGDDWFSPTKV